MTRLFSHALALAAICVVGVCIADLGAANSTPPSPEPPSFKLPPEPFVWRLPPGFPEPRVPADNPMSTAKVELGRHLFYDPRLSITGELSCAGCHRQELAFTDGRPRARGATGEEHPRGAMSLTNVAYHSSLGWDDRDLRRLEDQARIPMLADSPIELGLRGQEAEVLARLAADPRYQRLFPAAFTEATPPYTVRHLTHALAAFQRTLISGGSPYDRWLQGQPGALSSQARAGLKLFFSRRLGCGDCHGHFTFSGRPVFDQRPTASPELHNTGLYDLDGQGAYPPGGRGAWRFSGEPEDMGRFRAPTLRNIARTAPYMHDGNVATLDEVIDLYARGGRTDSPLKSPRLTGFELTAAEKLDLLRFLESLTDEDFLEDPRFADPWETVALSDLGK